MDLADYLAMGHIQTGGRIVLSRGFKFEPGISRQDRDKILERFTSPREFSDFFWAESLQAVRDRNSKTLLETLEKLKGFRHGFTHSDPTLKKFLSEFPIFFSRMTETDAIKTMDALYHIGIKDVEFWGAIYDHLRRSMEYYSYGALLRAFNIWEDNGLFGYKMELEEPYQRNFFNKTKAVLKQLTAEDTVLAGFLLESWGIPIDPIYERILKIDFPNLNSNKVISLNTYPKLLWLMANKGQIEDMDKYQHVVDQLPILMTIAYEQFLQNYELSDAYDHDMGVFDPLHWRSVGYYSKSYDKLGLSKDPNAMLVLEEAIYRKHECQVVDFPGGLDILANHMTNLKATERVKIYQMWSAQLEKEPSTISGQLRPDTLSDLISKLSQEMVLGELNYSDIAVLFLKVTAMLRNAEFDGQIFEMHDQQKEQLIADLEMVSAQIADGLIPPADIAETVSYIKNLI